MLILVSGPAGGQQGLLGAHLLSQTSTRSLAIARDGTVPVIEHQISDASFEALATLAERFAHPDAASKALLIADLDAIRTGRPYERAPLASDLAAFPGIQELCKGIATRQRPIDGLLIHNMSTLFEDVQARLFHQIKELWGERGFEAVRSIASNALTRIFWDLSHTPEQIVTIVTAWETETTLKGKVTGHTPHLPRAALGHVDLWLEVSPESTKTEIVTTIKGGSATTVPIGQTTSDWTTLVQYITG